MTDILDKNNRPTAEELGELINCELFDKLKASMNEEFKAICEVQYSGDNALPGWNIRFKKSGRTLCRVYPEKGAFSMLLVIGRKEKDRVEELLPTFTREFMDIYKNTQEGMGQRWLLIRPHHISAVFDDVMSVVRIRRQSK